MAAEIPVSPTPGAVVAAPGAVWVVASSTFAGEEGEPVHAVVRIDPTSEQVVATIPVPHPLVAVAAGEADVWATGTDFPPGADQPRGSVFRIDPATNEVTATVDLGLSAPSDVVLGHGSVWVSDSRGDAVHRIDQATGAVVASIPVPEGGPTSLAVTADWVWVAAPEDGHVHRIDPSGNAVSASVPVGSLPTVVAASDRRLFVSNYGDGDLTVVDTSGGREIEPIGFPTNASRLALGPETLIVTDAEDRSLWVVDLATLDPRRVLEDRRIVGLALDDSTLWAIDPEASAVLRIELPPRL